VTAKVAACATETNVPERRPPAQKQHACEEIMAKQLKAGDRVEWNTSGGKTSGRVKRKLTSSTKIKGHAVKASKQNPEYLVESSKSRKKAAHKERALTKSRS
jgi:hypothetical protein